MKLSSRRQSGTPGAPEDGSAVSASRPRRGPSGGCMALFFGIFLLVGLAATVPFLLAAWEVVSARGWEEVDCEVISSQVGVSSDGDTYRPEIHYRYSFRGSSYEGDRHGFLSSMYSSGRAAKERIVEAYPAGAPCRVWIDPDDPRRAVLDRSPSWSMLLVLLPLVFVGVGAGGVAFALGRGRRRVGGRPPIGGHTTLAGAVRTARTQASASGAAPSAFTSAPSGPLVLEPAVGPVAKIVGTLFVAVFWNGIVGLFVYLAWKDWTGGAGNWLMALFLVPFVLIGLLLISMVPYVFLQSFNPRATIEIARATLAVGDEVDVSWRFRGRVSRLSKISLRLRGRESATYTVGTDSRTRTSVFCDRLIHESNGPIMPFGSARLHIPADSMHSFDGGNNRIEWSLELAGEIPRWPDVQDSYPLDVGPGPADRDDSGW